MKISFFCSSSEKIAHQFFVLCEKIAEEMAKNRWTIVSGGANIGCMKRLVDIANKHNGHTIGILPEMFIEKKLVNYDNKELIFTRNMQDRKEKIIEISDACVILPGGIGTMDEFFEVITLNTLKITEKPVVLFNFDGFYDDLISFLNKLHSFKFAPTSKDLFIVVKSVNELFNFLKKQKKV